MTYNELYIRRISDLCARQNYSVNHLAAISGVSQSTLNHIMQGVSQNPRAMTLHKIARAFGMTLSEFLDFPELNLYSFENKKQ